MIYTKGVQEGKSYSDIFDILSRSPRNSKNGKDEDKKSKLSTVHR